MAPIVRGPCSLFLVLFSIAQVVELVWGAPAADLIPALPGQPMNVAFKQYAGYITVNETNDRNLFYYFIEAPVRSKNKPLALWLNGGPGCSALGGGAFSELGPFYPSKSGESLVSNPSSWIQEANIIFLESPAGVGFSYSNTTSDYTTDDTKTAQDSLTFLLKWLAQYPEYQNTDFYISGEGYAGHHIPQLAAAILHNNQVSGQFKIQLKGILVGSPVLDWMTDWASQFEYLWGHGMVSETTHDIIDKECKYDASAPENKACTDAQYLAYEESSFLNLTYYYVNEYDVLGNLCQRRFSQQAQKLIQLANENLTQSLFTCVEEEESVYLNLKQVQTALHAKPTNWSFCSALINYNSTSTTAKIAPVLSSLVKSGLRVWVYSGDADSETPLIGTRKVVNDLAKDLQLKITAPYKPWFQGKTVGGWSISWESLTYATVRGAGHFVPGTQPARSLQLFSSFIAGTIPPVAPTNL